jgi:hypothetical protein
VSLLPLLIDVGFHRFSSLAASQASSGSWPSSQMTYLSYRAGVLPAGGAAGSLVRARAAERDADAGEAELNCYYTWGTVMGQTGSDGTNVAASADSSTLLAGNLRLGFRLRKSGLHRGFGLVKLNHAMGLRVCLRRNGIGCTRSAILWSGSDRARGHTPWFYFRLIRSGGLPGSA